MDKIFLYVIKLYQRRVEDEEDHIIYERDAVSLWSCVQLAC